MWSRATENTIGFCQRWLQKASVYNDRLLDEAFDKFFSLFVAFNRLYCHFALHSRLTDGHGHDHEQATTGFAQAVGVPELARALDADTARDDLQALADLIAPGGGFYVAMKYGMEDVQGNRDLFAQLISTDSWERVTGLLEYLYRVRCHMFHGRKDLDDAQVLIIRPAARCLECVLLVGLDKLRAEPG